MSPFLTEKYPRVNARQVLQQTNMGRGVRFDSCPILQVDFSFIVDAQIQRLVVLQRHLTRGVILVATLLTFLWSPKKFAIYEAGLLFQGSKIDNNVYE